MISFYIFSNFIQIHPLLSMYMFTLFIIINMSLITHRDYRHWKAHVIGCISSYLDQKDMAQSNEVPAQCQVSGLAEMILHYSTCFKQFVYMEHHSIGFHGQWQYEVKNLLDTFFRWTFSALYFLKASVALFQNLSTYLKLVSNAHNALEMHNTFQ